jgi:hypothetical protein
MGFVGRGRIITEERVELCGAVTLWHVVLFMDDAVGYEREVGRSVNFAYADAIKARWEKVTCAVLGEAPIKNSATGLNARRKKPGGRDESPRRPPSAKKKNSNYVTPSN